MRRFAIILCFILRVIYGTYTVHRHEFSQQVTRKSRSNSPIMQTGYVYSQFNDRPGIYSSFGDPVTTHSSYAVHEPIESKSMEKLRSESPIYSDLIMPHTTPSITKSEVDYEIAKAAADARIDYSRMKSESMLDKLKSVMHYHPPSDASSEHMTGYDSSNDFHMDDDDVRTSSRGLYDSWPYFYHSPYEYEHHKEIFDTEKAKDKRYASEGYENIIPVHEHVEEDAPHSHTPKYYREVTDNPVGGDEPFFSFVLNDYFERSNEDDPLVFKGLDWGKDFDDESYLPEVYEFKRNRRLGNNYYSTGRPVPNHSDQSSHTDSAKYSQLESATESGHKKNHEFDKHVTSERTTSNHKKGYDNSAHNYNGFKDFVDTFANKFGSEDHKKNTNYVHQMNKDNGENRKGFRKVYHKDEYQEENEFYNNNNSSTKANENGTSNAHVGGTEAYLRSQAAAAVGDKKNSENSSGNTGNEKFENKLKGHDRINSLENQFNKYIDVAKQAAKSNNADYIDHYRI